MTEQHADPFKGLPRRLAIGHLTFRVVVVARGDKALDEKEGDSNLGLCSFEPPRIALACDQDLQYAVNTTLHEVIHAIHHTQGLTEDSSEEEFTDRTANGLIELLIRNPRFATWLNKHIRQLRKESTGD